MTKMFTLAIGVRPDKTRDLHIKSKHPELYIRNDACDSGDRPPIYTNLERGE